MSPLIGAGDQTKTSPPGLYDGFIEPDVEFPVYGMIHYVKFYNDGSFKWISADYKLLNMSDIEYTRLEGSYKFKDESNVTITFSGERPFDLLISEEGAYMFYDELRFSAEDNYEDFMAEDEMIDYF